MFSYNSRDELKSLSLLYVEDDQEISAGLEKVLARRMGRLHIARNGRHGLELFREHRPDIVLTDIRMPEMDGLAMARQIRQEQPSQSIIISTAFDDTAYLLEAIDLGIEQYVLKPLDIAKLLAALEKSAFRLSLERRLRQQTGEIQELNSRLQLLLDCAGEGICGIDRDGIFTFVNRAAELMLGWHPEELRGKRLHEIIHHQRADGTVYPFEECPTYRCLRSGEPALGEGELYWRKDGSAFPVEYITTPLLNVHREINGAVIVFKDISERKQAEEALARARDAAEAANRAKSEFLANMSHEIRTPLNSILGFTQLLQRDLNLNSAQREELQAIQRGGDHLLRLLNDILDLSKIEARKMELRPAFFRLSELLASVVEMSQTWCWRKPLHFDYQFSSALPVAVYGDETRLRQVLINLLGNAIKFTEQGQVRFEVECLDTQPGETCTLRFAVADTGIGIAQEHLAQLFQPFHQIEAQKHHSQGTGLGLAISKRFVEMMGGNLQVVSVAGQGSRFWFDLSLPLASEPSLPDSAASLSADGNPAESPRPPGPPAETVEALYRLSCLGDVQALAEAARELRARDSNLGEFAHRLEHLADNLETRKSREFIQSYRQAGG